jgi:stage II sporulation protein D
VPFLLVALASCVSGSVPSARTAPTPRPPTEADGLQSDPEIRIGIVTGSASVTVGGNQAVAVNQPDGSRVTTIPPGETWQLSATGSRIALRSPTGWSSIPLDGMALAAVEPSGFLRVNGKYYRGVADVLRDSAGLTVVNRLGIEAYLLGVVSAEMGRRSFAEQSALEAQAVVSRTYAIRNLGRWKARGFDLTAGVSDQVYGGANSETPEGRAAVRDTRGRVLTYNGAPIEAFYYSTCGGRTADGFEVFRGAAQPYLRSVADRAENGTDYCSISPRYRWHEEWTDATLRATLERNLPQVAGVRRPVVREVRDIRVSRRTPSGRVDELAIALGGPEVRITGLAIRQVLRPSSGELLRSNVFTLSATGAGERVTHLAADGTGAGHGVGFCQWGAVGRARVGQGYEQILAAYYPGTRVMRRY